MPVSTVEMSEEYLLDLKERLRTLDEHAIFSGFVKNMSEKIDAYEKLPENVDKNEALNSIKNIDQHMTNEIGGLAKVLKQFKVWSTAEVAVGQDADPNKVTALVKRLAKDLCDYFQVKFTALLFRDLDSDIFLHRKKLLLQFHEQMKIANSGRCDSDLVVLISKVVNREGVYREYPGSLRSKLLKKLTTLYSDINSSSIELRDTSYLQQKATDLQNNLEQKDIQVEQLSAKITEIDASVTQNTKTLMAEKVALESQVKSLTTKNTALESQVKSLTTKNEALESRLERLEARFEDVLKSNEDAFKSKFGDVLSGLGILIASEPKTAIKVCQNIVNGFGLLSKPSPSI
jgi:DNA repair exonuclease SbcCD ATPase subunit